MPLVAQQKILFVDDNSLLLACLGDYIEYHGFEVIRAGSGPQALHKLKRVKPDLILLDPLMGSKKGVKLVKQLASHPHSRECPVIIYTANADMEEFFRNTGVDDFVCKTVPEQELIRRIRRVLPAPQAQQSAASTAAMGNVKVQQPRYHRTQSPAATGKQGKGQGRLLLIAEDEPANARQLERALTALGFAVDVAETGKDLITKLETLEPAAIIVKEVLTGMNGSVAIATIQASKTHGSVPIVLYDDTGTLQGRQRRTGLSEGTAVIHSSDVDDLLPALQQVLKRNRTS